MYSWALLSVPQTLKKLFKILVPRLCFLDVTNDLPPFQSPPFEQSSAVSLWARKSLLITHSNSQRKSTACFNSSNGILHSKSKVRPILEDIMDFIVPACKLSCTVSSSVSALLCWQGPHLHLKNRERLLKLWNWALPAPRKPPQNISWISTDLLPLKFPDPTYSSQSFKASNFNNWSLLRWHSHKWHTTNENKQLMM